MIKTTFIVPIYQIQVTLVMVESPKDKDAVEAIFKKFQCGGSERSDGILDSIENGDKDGGALWRGLNRREMLVILHQYTSKKARRNTFCHEKRHIEDRILEHAGIDDMEAAAYLSGWLGERFFEFEQMIDNSDVPENKRR
jgi:hypothetical protein